MRVPTRERAHNISDIRVTFRACPMKHHYLEPSDIFQLITGISLITTMAMEEQGFFLNYHIQNNSHTIHTIIFSVQFLNTPVQYSFIIRNHDVTDIRLR